MKHKEILHSSTQYFISLVTDLSLHLFWKRKWILIQEHFLPGMPCGINKGPSPFHTSSWQMFEADHKETILFWRPLINLRKVAGEEGIPSIASRTSAINFVFHPIRRHQILLRKHAEVLDEAIKEAKTHTSPEWLYFIKVTSPHKMSPFHCCTY